MEKKTHKRKHRTKHVGDYSSPPPCSDEEAEEFQETKAKRHKKKKRKHTKNDKGDNSQPLPLTLADKDTLLPDTLLPAETLDTKVRDAEENSVTSDPVKSTQDPVVMTTPDTVAMTTQDPLVTDSVPVDIGCDNSSTSHSLSPKHIDDVVLKKTMRGAQLNSIECDTDTLSGGSTPLLPHQEGFGPLSINEEDERRVVKRKKHKQKEKGSERKRRHKKHRRHKDDGRHDKPSKKKSRKVV